MVYAIAIVAWAGLWTGIKEELTSPLARVTVFAALGCMYGFVAMMLANFI